MSTIELQKHKPNEGRRRKDGQKFGGGKMNSRRVFIGLKNMRLFTAAKDPMLQRSLPTQRRRELRRDVLEDLAKATQQRRVLRYCVPEVG